MSFLDRFAVLLLDMNGTFMFGHDRFGPDQDYFASYNALGGGRLNRDQLLSVFLPSLATLLEIYDDPARFDDFPTLPEVFAGNGASDDDLPILERLFAAHEIGQVPRAHADFIGRVAATHELGVVSNICSHPDLWLNSNSSAGVFFRIQDAGVFVGGTEHKAIASAVPSSAVAIPAGDPDPLRWR